MMNIRAINIAPKVLLSIILFILGSFLFLAIITYSPFDPGWSYLASDTRDVANLMGSIGAWFADFLHAFLGWASLLFPIFILLGIWNIWQTKTKKSPTKLRLLFRYIAQFILMINSAMLLHLIFPNQELALSGGIIGASLGSSMVQALTMVGAVIFLIIFFLFVFTVSFNLKWKYMPAFFKRIWFHIKDIFYFSRTDEQILAEYHEQQQKLQELQKQQAIEKFNASAEKHLKSSHEVLEDGENSSAVNISHSDVSIQASKVIVAGNVYTAPHLDNPLQEIKQLFQKQNQLTSEQAEVTAKLFEQQRLAQQRAEMQQQKARVAAAATVQQTTEPAYQPIVDQKPIVETAPVENTTTYYTEEPAPTVVNPTAHFVTETSAPLLDKENIEQDIDWNDEQVFDDLIKETTSSTTQTVNTTNDGFFFEQSPTLSTTYDRDSTHSTMTNDIDLDIPSYRSSVRERLTTTEPLNLESFLRKHSTPATTMAYEKPAINEDSLTHNFAEETEFVQASVKPVNHQIEQVKSAEYHTTPAFVAPQETVSTTSSFTTAQVSSHFNDDITPTPHKSFEVEVEPHRPSFNIPAEQTTTLETPATVAPQMAMSNRLFDDEFDKPLTDATGRPISRAMQVVEQRKHLSPLPSLDLLDPVDPNAKVSFDEYELQRMAELLEIKLQDFNIKAVVRNKVTGPVVTRFELELAPGVQAAKVSKISQDLARSLAVASVRVVPVIVGTSYIGIEIPNKKREMVRLIELVNTPQFRDKDSLLTMAMGKDISGKPVLADLAKAPHVLVAGTTGSGKSVAVNSMLLTMLLKYTPEELRLVLIDPKQLELANYSDIPHLLTPVVTDMKDAVNALNWCVKEMERRYKLLAALKVRKINDYNDKIRQAQLAGEDLYDITWKASDSATQERAPRLEPLPMIVVIADEFADMMMQVGKKAEEMITRLAQKSRACGIHLLLATQRPSVDVVTGLIKANIPTRVALRVNSLTDSRTVLDAKGAEDLLGHGDMLFLAPGKNEPERVHGAFISDDEVNRICDAWRERGFPNYVEDILDDDEEESSSGGYTSGEDDSTQDVLFDQAVELVLSTKKTSASNLQRQFSIGYNRAARLIDTMEKRGIISEDKGGGKRDILI